MSNPYPGTRALFEPESYSLRCVVSTTPIAGGRQRGNAHQQRPTNAQVTLLKKLDVAQNFAENAFGRNVDVIKTLLEVVMEHGFYERAQVRDLASYINSIGGVTIIDSIPHDELRELFTAKIEQLSVSA